MIIGANHIVISVEQMNTMANRGCLGTHSTALKKQAAIVKKKNPAIIVFFTFLYQMVLKSVLLTTLHMTHHEHLTTAQSHLTE